MGKCDGSGFIWIKDWSKRHEKNVMDECKKECDCYQQQQKQREIDKKLDLSGIPPIFSRATVHSFDTSLYTSDEDRNIAEVAKIAAVNFVENYPIMKEHGKGLYLYSRVKGSGKTRLASSIANALIKQYGADIAFIKSADLISQVKKTFGSKETNASDVVATFRKVELLIVDDLALKGATSFEEGVIYDVMDYRMENKKPTILTSNVTIQDLENIYPGGRVNKRINKMAMEIYMPEESIRDQEAEQENAEFEKILFGE
ncbi:IstB-like ATP-binding protein [Sporosarcina sp. NCCP-2222]|nr:IstB-like ATP-binding protein [Sporosarcina sp. NCCP-2222]